jgi:hypothetical protein
MVVEEIPIENRSRDRKDAAAGDKESDGIHGSCPERMELVEQDDKC